MVSRPLAAARVPQIIIKNGRETGRKPLQNIVHLFSPPQTKEVQWAARSSCWALEAPGEPGSMEARGQGLALQALWGLLICISQVRWLVWLQLLQPLLTMASEKAKSQPKLRQHWQSKLLSSPMALIHGSPKSWCSTYWEIRKTHCLHCTNKEKCFWFLTFTYSR